MIERPTLLYTASGPNSGLFNDISEGCSDAYECIHLSRVSPIDFGLLEDVCGVVFVETQTAKKGSRVFTNTDWYFRFLAEAQTQGLRAVAILKRNHDLPKKNEGISRVFRLPRDTNDACQVCSPLVAYFDKHTKR